MFKPVDNTDPVVALLEREAAIVKRAAELLEHHGLAQRGWTFVIDRAIRRVGQCRYSKKEIAFSAAYMHVEWLEIEDTILHEIAHALVGSGHGHNYVWKAKCREVGARPERLAPPTVKTSVAPSYMIQCPKCDRKWYRHRMRRQNYRARCPDCNVQVVIYRVRPKSSEKEC